MRFVRKLQKSIASQEPKIKKTFDWIVSIGNFLFLVFRMLMQK